MLNQALLLCVLSFTNQICPTGSPSPGRSLVGRWRGMVDMLIYISSYGMEVDCV
jgi:hypothetical protein